MKNYRDTVEWVEFRAEAIARADGRCQLCNSSENLQVHHRLYEENTPAAVSNVIDLTVLCGRCHIYFHRGQRNKQVGGENSKAPVRSIKKKRKEKHVEVVNPTQTKVKMFMPLDGVDFGAIFDKHTSRNIPLRLLEESRKKNPDIYRGAKEANGSSVL